MWETLGIVLMHRDSPAEHERGLALLGHARDLCLNGRFYLSELRTIDVYTAQERAVGLTPDGGHLTGGTAGPAGRLSVCRASVGSTPRSSGSRLPAW